MAISPCPTCVIPYVIRPRTARPLVILTTNEDRELPPAFVRRCLVLHLQLPSGDDALLKFLCQRGAVHFLQRCSETVRRRAAELLLHDRKAALAQGFPPPGQAEYLDLLRAVSGMQPDDEAAQMDLLKHISPFALHKSTPPRG